MQSNLARSTKAIGAAITLSSTFFSTDASAWRGVSPNNSNSYNALVVRMEKKNTETSHISTLEDANQFIKLIERSIPSLYQGPTPERILELAPEINALKLADIINSSIWENYRFYPILGPKKEDHIESHLINSLESFAEIKWAVIENRHHDSKVKAWTSEIKDYNQIQNLNYILDKLIDSPLWESDQAFKAALNGPLELPWMPLRQGALDNLSSNLYFIKERKITALIEDSSLYSKALELYVKDQNQKQSWQDKKDLLKNIGYIGGGFIGFAAFMSLVGWVVRGWTGNGTTEIPDLSKTVNDPHQPKRSKPIDFN